MRRSIYYKYRHLPPLPPEEVPPEPDQYKLADEEIRNAKAQESIFAGTAPTEDSATPVEAEIDTDILEVAHGDWYLYDQMVGVKRMQEMIEQNPDDESLRANLEPMLEAVHERQVSLGIVSKE